MKFNWRVRICLFIVSILFFPIFIASAGFGVSPPEIVENKLVPGSSFERTIQLVQGTPQNSVPVKVEVDSSRMKGWISFPEGNEFTIPAGVQQYPLKVRISVPEDAELGLYKAFIRVATVPTETKGVTNSGQVAIALGGRVDVELEVGDDVIVEYEIRDIEILDIKEGEKPQVKVRITNTGNVPVAPDSATFELFNKFGDIRLAFSQSEEFEQVPAFSDGEIILDFPMDVHLAIGEYWGHAKIYDDEGQIRRELRTVFNVEEKTFLEKYGIWLGVLGVVVLLSLLAFITYMFVPPFKGMGNKKK